MRIQGRPLVVLQRSVRLLRQQLEPGQSGLRRGCSLDIFRSGDESGLIKPQTCEGFLEHILALDSCW